jgi:hypothetical protein
VLFGAVFDFVFLTLNDPDATSPTVLSASKWLVLLPAAFLIAMRSSIEAWLQQSIFATVRDRAGIPRSR